ncbi:MAG: enoyl-CoA hydratase/isomerase family protein [Anaerolineae bacterium]
MSDGIEFQIDDDIALLRVNRPQARNALNWAAQEAFAAAVTELGRDRRVRVLIITGAGDRAFVSGGDLKELSRRPETAAGERLNRVMSAALARLTALPLPVIAAVNGDAYGGGCEILTACDLRLAAAHARFSFAQVRNGLTTGWGGTGRLVRLIGHSRAMDFLLTSRPFEAQEALRLGFVHRVVLAGEDVLAAAYGLARKLCALPRQALAATKQLTYAASALPPDEVGRLETELFTRLWQDPDHLEAMRAFVEKREPVFNAGPRA